MTIHEENNSLKFSSLNCFYLSLNVKTTVKIHTIFIFYIQNEEQSHKYLQNWILKKKIVKNSLFWVLKSLPHSWFWLCFETNLFHHIQKFSSEVLFFSCKQKFFPRQYICLQWRIVCSAKLHQGTTNYIRASIWYRG